MPEHAVSDDGNFWPPDTYIYNGITLRGGGACPEQYDAYLDTDPLAATIGYFRLRHGDFTVTCPDVGGELVFEGEPNGDGMFDDNERNKWLNEGIDAVKEWLLKSTIL